ncbi:ABC transporter substrate-binding protein [Occultella aeris]|uniref:ABC transporter substrate-binding protein YesO n=1 Tax=Occultella aeris TaxID=2761496 RepID=A0A7M4DIK4_9MICO|nr:extracellular solute-binding protein [Occultella aeris]VZO36813.1 Putative ABC transporter substrate-binding protein YesO [Occultella aeris]
MRNIGFSARREHGRGRGVAAIVGAGLVLALAACGQADDGDTAAGDGGTSGEGEAVTIRFAWWGNEDRAAITNEAVALFETANPNITVETEYVDFNAYFDRLATTVAAGDAPDVITMGGAYPREYGDRGALLDLAEVAEYLDTSTLDAGALSNGFFSDTQYGVPTGANTYGVVINPAIFEAAGVDLPDQDSWTWDDFAEIAAEISANTPDGTYGAADPTSAEVLDLYLNHQSGHGLYLADGSLNATPELVADWFTYSSGLMESGATPPATITSELTTQTSPEQSLLGQGLAAMSFGWSNNLGAFREASGQDLILIRVPGDTGPNGSAMWQQASQLYTINAGTEHPEAAAQLVDFLVNSTDAADLIGTDRGVPSNETIRAYLSEQGLEPTTQVEFDFLSQVSEFIDGDFVIGPTGSTESAGILTRLNQEVLFGQTSPEDAGVAFVTEVTTAIS